MQFKSILFKLSTFFFYNNQTYGKVKKEYLKRGLNRYCLIAPFS